MIYTNKNTAFSHEKQGLRFGKNMSANCEVFFCPPGLIYFTMQDENQLLRVLNQ